MRPTTLTTPTPQTASLTARMLAIWLFVGLLLGASATAQAATTFSTTWRVSDADPYHSNGPPPPLPVGIGEFIGITITIPDAPFLVDSRPGYASYSAFGTEVEIDYGLDANGASTGLGPIGRLTGFAYGESYMILRDNAFEDQIAISLRMPRFEYDGTSWQHGRYDHTLSLFIAGNRSSLFSGTDTGLLGG